MIIPITSPISCVDKFIYISLDYTTKNMYLTSQFNKNLIRHSRIDTNIGNHFVFEETKYVNPHCMYEGSTFLFYQSLVSSLNVQLQNNDVQSVGEILNMITCFQKIPKEYFAIAVNKRLGGAVGCSLSTYGFLFLYK